MARITLMTGTTNPPMFAAPLGKIARTVPSAQRSARAPHGRRALTGGVAPHRLDRRRLRGAVAQLGERDVRNVEVRGSIPLCSTIQKPAGILDFCGFFTVNRPRSRPAFGGTQL